MGNLWQDIRRRKALYVEFAGCTDFVHLPTAKLLVRPSVCCLSLPLPLAPMSHGTYVSCMLELTGAYEFHSVVVEADIAGRNCRLKFMVAPASKWRVAILYSIISNAAKSPKSDCTCYARTRAHIIHMCNCECASLLLSSRCPSAPSFWSPRCEDPNYGKWGNFR